MNSIFGNNQVYFNEYYPAEFAKLLSKTRKAARERNCKFVWVRKDLIFVKKDVDSDEVLYIWSMSDVDQMLPWQLMSRRPIPALVTISSSSALFTCHVNAQSIMAYFDQFIAFVLSTNCDIVAVSETWLRSTTVDSICCIPGYANIRCDRGDRTGGGVCLYVKSCYDTKLVLSSNNVRCTTKIEFLFAELIGTSRRKLLLEVIYHPPGISFNYFDSILSNTIDKYYDKLIFGDWNADLCKTSPDAFHLYHLFEAVGLHVLDSLSTDHSDRTSTLLDLCLVHDVLKASNFHQFAVRFLSKYDLIGVRYFFQPTILQSESILRRNYNNIDDDSIVYSFLLVDWQSLPYNLNFDEVVDTINVFLIELLDYHALPVSHTIRRPTAPWLTTEIRDIMRSHNALRRKFSRGSDSHILNEYRRSRNKVKSLIRQAER